MFLNGWDPECHMQTHLYVIGDQQQEAGPCSTLSHNKLCGNSVIDGILESSLSVTINYNLLCIRVCAFYKSSLDSVYRQHEDTMVIRVEGSRNLLSGEDLQWVSRVCCLLCVGR